MGCTGAYCERILVIPSACNWPLGSVLAKHPNDELAYLQVMMLNCFASELLNIVVSIADYTKLRKEVWDSTMRQKSTTVANCADIFETRS